MVSELKVSMNLLRKHMQEHFFFYFVRPSSFTLCIIPIIIMVTSPCTQEITIGKKSNCVHLLLILQQRSLFTHTQTCTTFIQIQTSSQYLSHCDPSQYIRETNKIYLEQSFIVISLCMHENKLDNLKWSFVVVFTICL